MSEDRAKYGRRHGIPADFNEVAASMHQKDLAAHYGVSKATITNWTRKTGARTLGTRFSMPADFPEKVRGGSRASELMELYHVGLTTIYRWLGNSGLSILAAPLPRECTGVRRAGASKKLPTIAPAHDGSRAARAAEFLRRRDPVFRCDEAGKPDQKGAFWFTCSRVLTGGDLVQRAEARGWQPDAWKQLGEVA